MYISFCLFSILQLSKKSDKNSCTYSLRKVWAIHFGTKKVPCKKITKAYKGLRVSPGYSARAGPGRTRGD